VGTVRRAGVAEGGFSDAELPPSIHLGTCKGWLDASDAD
jgi:hypothetical protein